MNTTLPLSVLDFVDLEYGESAHSSIEGAVRLAQRIEAAGYRRYWVSEHHNMQNLSSTAPEILIAHLGARTSSLRIGAAGIMLPNHAAFKVAEVFRTLVAMYPGRIDLGVGRAPGTDPLAESVLRRGLGGSPTADFPAQMEELLGFLGEGFPVGHPYRNLVAAPVVEEVPQIFILGSSDNGPQFAAANGLAAAFAHHVNPGKAVEALRNYRRDFTPRRAGDEAYSAMSVLAFASDDEDALWEFEAGWMYSVANLRRGVSAPLHPERLKKCARSGLFRALPRDRDRVITGSALVVAERLLELKNAAQVDEVVLLTPCLNRERRITSLVAIADAWRQQS